MFFKNEIKDFIKNTLILTLIFTLAIDLSWSYIAPMFWLSTNASTNDTKFSQVNVTYLGNIATAMSLNIGQKDKSAGKIPVNLSSAMISIAEVVSYPEDGQRRLIGGNMVAINTYNNLLSTDIISMLDRATDRTIALDEHISLLRDYGNQTNERIMVLDEQIADLNAIVTRDSTDIESSKAEMQSSYINLDYTDVDVAISRYTKAKQTDIRARVYLVYLQNFRELYIKLQSKNKNLIEVLSSNREALIKRAVVTIPSSGTNLLKDLNLIQTESEAKAKQSIQ